MSPSVLRPSRAEIDLGAIGHNVSMILERVAPAAVLVAVKADAYGHGAVAVARAALAAGANALGVATVDEGLELRTAGISDPILVLAPPSAEGFAAAIPAGLEVTVADPEHVGLAAEVAAQSGAPARLHLKVDTGMHRMGCAPEMAAVVARTIVAKPGVSLVGTFTHLACADDLANPATTLQLDRFEEALAGIRTSGIAPGLVHAANSAGAIGFPASRFDLVRVGIAAYGVAPCREWDVASELRPALRLVSSVSALRTVRPGDGISYGHRFRCEAPLRVATVPVGYADGVRRDSGLRGVEVLVGGRRRPIRGAVTMDQLMVEVDDAVDVGDEVVLIGSQGDLEITADEVADRLETISYEVLAGIGSRIPRIWSRVTQ